MKILIRLFVSTLAILISAYLISGVRVESFFSALVFAVVLGVLNAILRPILLILTLPITFLTLGLFALVINTVVIMLAGWLVPGFFVASFWSAFLFGVVLAVVNGFFKFFKK